MAQIGEVLELLNTLMLSIIHNIVKIRKAALANIQIYLENA